MTIEWLAAAKDDLQEIAQWVVSKFGYDIAEQTVADIVAETNRLAFFPEMGRQCYHGSRHAFRAIHTHNNRIVYTITDKYVLIVAVFDNRRNPSFLTRLLQKRDVSF